MKRLRPAWQRFWFEPEPTSTLALVRIAFGLVVLVWTLSLIRDADAFFSSEGLLSGSSYAGESGASWGLLDVFEGWLAVGLVLGALTLASLLLIVGQDTRVAALVVFVCVLSLERRNPFVFNSGDGLIRITAFFLMLAPSGTSLSLDRWRRAREAFWEFPARAPWALRLMQVQLSIIYLASVSTKLAGDLWNNGTAVSFALRLEDLKRFDAPLWLTDSELAINLLSYCTLALEAALGILVWNRTLRPYVLGLGVAMHLSIDLSLRVGYFSYALFILYIAFLSPEWVSRSVIRVRDRVRERSSGRRPELAAVPPAAR